ncbi:hypothetical protein D1007_01091 [Hordeum vulgare]|nr:hypothetical protein D1007_01091 [Hordeum vulgare]
MPEQRAMRAYEPDSPDWERLFALEHEEECRRGVNINHSVPLPLPEVLSEEEDEKVAYRAALELAIQHMLEASRIKEDAKWVSLDRALALSDAGNSVHAPLFIPEPPSPPPPIIEPKEEPTTSHKRSSPPPSWPEEKYEWVGVVREWVSAPPVHFDAKPEEEAAHLEQWWQN